MARRRSGRRRASRRSYSGPVSARGFTSKQTLTTLAGATGGLVVAPIVSIKLADAMRDEKTKKSPLDGPVQNAAVAAGVGVAGGLLLKGLDRNAAGGFFVGATAGGIATGLVAWARSKGMIAGLGGDQDVSYRSTWQGGTNQGWAESA